MARISKNNFTSGLSGMVGGIMVFKSWNGKTYVSTRPEKPRKQSALQRENRQKFKMATAFAKSMMKDPIKKAEYQQKAKELLLPNAYTAAITEYMRKPEINAPDISKYKGRKGQEINVDITKKDFDVEEVEIEVVLEGGEVVEKGEAERKFINYWSYKTIADVENKVPVIIVITARDVTGTVYKKSFPLSDWGIK